MAYLKTKMGALAAAAVAVLAPATAAHADAQYKADRAYCMSGQATEARDLCLKEAVAAEAERKGSHPASGHHKHHSAKQDAAAAPEKSASTP